MRRRRKTIGEVVDDGVTIDAAVKRAVREAVPRTRTISEIFRKGTAIDAAAKRAIRSAVLGNEAYSLVELAMRKGSRTIRDLILKSAIKPGKPKTGSRRRRRPRST
jgi:hypothetical protein